MIRIDLAISGEIWSIRLNEDSSKQGCNFLNNEIWANGTRTEMRETVEKSLRAVVRPENEHLVAGITERIMKCVGMSI